MSLGVDECDYWLDCFVAGASTLRVPSLVWLMICLQTDVAMTLV